MRAFTLLLLLGAAVTASAVSDQGKQKATPIQKVIQMLTDMLAKGKKEKQEETVRFAAFKQFCESTAGEKTKNIATAKEEIEQLEATIAKAQADVVELTDFIAGLDGDVSTWTDDLATSTAERKKEKAEFD